jgi:hypothetical protein
MVHSLEKPRTGTGATSYSEDFSPTNDKDANDLSALGYKPKLRRNRSMFTLLFQSLAIAAVRALPISLEF